MMERDVAVATCDEVVKMADFGSFLPGTVLDGRYRLVRLLAQGGMGAVWVGEQVTLQREVAIKLLRLPAEALHARLQREALALAAVHHPAVVQVYDYGETEEKVPYLVMEFVKGETVGAKLHKTGTFSAPEAAILMLPLLDGLNAAHAVGIIHRDIKPDNVLLCNGPSGVLPKLLDFGIARRDQSEAARLTAEGGLIGTPAYMAPEQVRGAPTDERTDVWGMGVLFYEMIAGKPPFGVEDVIVVIRRVLDDPPPFPTNAVGLDGKLWAVLMNALRKNPAERTPSARAFRDAIAGWLSTRGIVPFSEGAPRGAETTQPAATPFTSAAAATIQSERASSAGTPPPSDPENPGRAALDALIRQKLR
ncbi:MAG: serine/threonine protein kinase [Polyangiaceae bacterium]|nr:serine/threonine protein kinase [Polyangiaceae bacterium]